MYDLCCNKQRVVYSLVMAGTNSGLEIQQTECQEQTNVKKHIVGFLWGICFINLKGPFITNSSTLQQIAALMLNAGFQSGP